MNDKIREAAEDICTLSASNPDDCFECHNMPDRLGYGWDCGICTPKYEKEITRIMGIIEGAFKEINCNLCDQTFMKIGETFYCEGCVDEAGRE